MRSLGHDLPARRIDFTYATWITSRKVSVARDSLPEGYVVLLPTVQFGTMTSLDHIRPASAGGTPTNSRIVAPMINRSSYWTMPQRSAPPAVDVPVGIATLRYRSPAIDLEHRPDGCRRGTTIQILFRRITVLLASLSRTCSYSLKIQMP